MVQNTYHGSVITGGQPSVRIVAATTAPLNRQNAPPITPKPSRPLNHKDQPCPVCQRVNCRNVCRNDRTSSPSVQISFPARIARRPSVDGRQEGQPRRPRANRILSPTADPSASPTMPHESPKPRTARKVSDPSSSIPISQPKRPPSRSGPPEHTGSSSSPQNNQHARGRKSSGPPPVIPKPQQRRARSRSSTRDLDPVSRQSPPRMRPNCREWLKGNCPEGSNCPFTHDPEARVAEQLRLKKVAEEQAAKAALEAAATVEETVLPSTKVTFGAGVAIKEVLTGHETCRVLVKNLPMAATKAEVVALFTQSEFNPAKFNVRPPRLSQCDSSHLEAVIEFQDPEDGKNAVARLDGIEFGSEKLKVAIIPKQGGMENPQDRNSYILTVTWPAPSETAFASYSSLSEAYSKRMELENATFKGRKIKTHFAKKPTRLPYDHWNSATVSVSGFEPGTPVGSIRKFCGTAIIRMAKGSPRSYNLNYAIPSLQLLVTKAFPENFEAVTWEPNLVANERGFVSAKLHFPTWHHAKTVHDFLDQKPLPVCPQLKCFTFLPDPFHYAIHVPRSQYKAQEKLFQSLIPPQNDRTATTHLHIRSNQPNRPVRIELSGSDKKTIGRLKVRIEQLLTGVKLPQWDRVFYGAEGETFLEKVNNDSRAYVRVDKRQGALKAFGEPAAVERAKAMIQGEVNRLASLRFEVPLKRASVRFFVDGARGSTLLKEEVGEENVMLDVSSSPCKIVVCGGELARHCLHKLIDESLSHAVRSQHQLKDEETCPICYDTIDQPYRLACDHAYCYGCLRHFLLTASDTKRFPLLCMADEGRCCVPIPLPAIQRFLLPSRFKRLLEVSFLEHLGHHPDKFRYCTTPDCPEIYSFESGAEDGMFQCRSCFVTVCASCWEDHEGFSCEEWMTHRDPETQERLLEGWAEGNNDVKKCPHCRILIEKNGGCNHMICPKCSSHICWRCMGVFPADEIYHHMELVHGGIDDRGGAFFGF